MNKCVKPQSIEWDKFVNTHLSHSRPWFNIQIHIGDNIIHNRIVSDFQVRPKS